MHMASFVSNSNYVLSDTYCTGHRAPTEDAFFIGGSNNLENVNYTNAIDGSPQIEYFRALNTGDQYDAVLTWGTTQPLIVAWGPLPVSFHRGNHLSESFLFSKTDSASENNSTSNYNFWTFHGIALLIVWTVFNSFGYIFARFFKHLSWWIWVHNIGSGFTAIFSIGILFASLTICKNKFLICKYLLSHNSASDTPDSTSDSIHMTFGMILLVLICIQFVTGLINYFCIYKRKRHHNDYIHKFKNLHRYLGIFLTFTVYINIITGFIIQWENLM